MRSFPFQIHRFFVRHGNITNKEGHGTRKNKRGSGAETEESDPPIPGGSGGQPPARWKAMTRPGLKLRKKAQVIFKKEAQIIDPEFQHGNPLDSHPEGKTGHRFRIVSHHLEDLGIHHPRT